MTGPRPLVVAASPRAGGNTDRAADLLAQAAAEAAQGSEPLPEVVRLRDYGVLPCLGCGACAAHPRGQCVRAGEDRAEELFARLMDAPWLAVCSPIYFYHLPAQCKAWVDRSQRHYLLRGRGDEAMLALPGRPAHVCLVAGRPRGERLFEGALLTLRYFLAVYNFSLDGVATLRGLDGPDALDADGQARRAVEDLGRAAGREAAGNPERR